MAENKFQFSRGNCQGVGQDYKKHISALIALSLEQQNEEFDLGVNMGVNFKDEGKFDDVTINLKTKNIITQQILIQLKHVKNTRNKLTFEELENHKSLQAYLSSYIKIQNKLEQNTKLILFTNLAVDETKLHSIYFTFKEIDDREETWSKLLKTKNQKVYKLIPNDRFFNNQFRKAQNNDVAIIKDFFDKFAIYTCQLNVVTATDKITKYFISTFKAEAANSLQFCYLVNQWINQETITDIIPSKPTVTRKVIKKWLAISLLKPHLILIKPSTQSQENQWNVIQELSQITRTVFLQSDYLNTNWKFTKNDDFDYTCGDNKTPLVVKVNEQNKTALLQAIKYSLNSVICIAASKMLIECNELAYKDQTLADVAVATNKNFKLYKKFLKAFDLTNIEHNRKLLFPEIVLKQIHLSNLFELEAIKESARNIKNDYFYLKRVLQVSCFRTESVESFLKDSFVICVYKNITEKQDLFQTFKTFSISHSIEACLKSKLATKQICLISIND